MNDVRIRKIIEREGGNFEVREFQGDRRRLRKRIMEHIVRWRNWHGFPFQITSAWRESGSHSTGLAIDGLIWQKGKWRLGQPEPMHIWRLATTYPWMGVGIYFDWDDGIGLHLDLIQPSVRERPLRWFRVDHKYFYQHPKSGKFIHSSDDHFAVLSLDQIIEEHQKHNTTEP